MKYYFYGFKIVHSFSFWVDVDIRHILPTTQLWRALAKIASCGTDVHGALLVKHKKFDRRISYTKIEKLKKRTSTNLLG